MIENIIARRVRPATARWNRAGWNLPACAVSEVSFALKAIHAPSPDARDADIAALIDIGERASWIDDSDLCEIASRTGSPRSYLRHSVARLNRWLSGLAGYLDRTTGQRSRAGNEISFVPGWRTAIVLAGDEIGLGPWTITHALLAGARAIIKPSAVEPLATFRFATALLERGAGCPNLLYLDTNVPPGRESLSRIVAASHQAVVFGEDATIEAVFGDRPTTPAHKPIAYWSGRSGAIVLQNADLALAARAVVRGAAEDRGNRCDSTKRVLVPRRAAAEFESLLRREADAIVRGDPVAEGTELGRLDRRARELAERAAAGDDVIYDRDLIIARCSSDRSRLLCDELPYPIIGIKVYDDGDDPVEIANEYVAGTAPGLALIVSIFSASRERFREAALRTKARKVHWNRITTHIDLMTTHQGTHLFQELMREREVCP